MLEVRNLTVRDICDCIARGFAQSLAPGDKWDFDEHAVLKNAANNIEIMMGVFPAIEGLVAHDV